MRNVISIWDQKTGSSGFSLLETIIVLGILAIISMGMATQFSGLHKQVKGISQKQEVAELKRLMMTELSRTDVCSWQLLNKTLDASGNPNQATPSSTVVDLGNLYEGPDSGSALLAQAGQPVPGTQTGLRVSNVNFKNAYATGNPNEYIGTFEVQFDPSTTVVPIKNIQVKQIVRTNPSDPANARRIQGCVGGGNIRTQCATAYKPMSGPTTLAFHNFTTAPDISEVFEEHEFTGGENPWGLSCKTPYLPMGCGYVELAVDTTLAPDLISFAFGKQGCFTDDEERASGAARIDMTCCKLTAETL